MPNRTGLLKDKNLVKHAKNNKRDMHSQEKAYQDKHSRSRTSHKTTQSYNSRAIAAQAIYAILESGKSLQEVLPNSLEKLKEADKAWLHEMLYGVLRNLPTIQFWLRQLLTAPIKNESRVVEHLLYLGLYQLKFSRVAEHAAVSETVAACGSLKQTHLKGLVNAVLRNFQRKEEQELEIADERIQLNLPKWYFKKLICHYPDSYQTIAHQQAQKPPIWLRVNNRKISCTDYLQYLNDADISFDYDEQFENGVLLTKSQRIEELPGYEDGLFSVQDKAAQHAAFYLAPEPGDVILDACAAPGGKYLHLLESQTNLQRCIALEIDETRIVSIAANAERLGISDIELCVGDAADSKSWNKEALKFDKILLDAPCSATGIIRRHPDILWLRKAQDIENLVTLQADIIDDIWQQLKSGGVLVYATCSILPEENHLQVLNFLSRTPDALHLPLTQSDCPEKPGRQILPGESGMDGFYYAKMQKR